MRKFSKLKILVKLCRILSIGISALFHPLLLPTYIFTLIRYYAPIALSPLNTAEMRDSFIRLIFLSTFFLPFLLLTLYIMIQNGQWAIKNFFMENAKERVFPLFVIGSVYSVLTYFIKSSPYLNELIFAVMTCTTLSILMIALISNFWKISAHAVGISGTIGLLAIVNYKIADATLFFPITILIVLAGFLFSARLYLNAHYPAQIWAGSLLGFLMSGFGYFFL